jgi:tripartite-type tricarboxylate transporter receptor subunit TctC
MLMLGAVTAQAQQYPVKPIRFVTTSGPDALPRLLGQKFTAAWGQQVLIDPQAGGGGMVSASVVVKAPPDGHTLLLATGAHTISPSFLKLPYDMARDFAPVSLVAIIPFVLAINPSLPPKSVQELIKLARARPGELNYGSGGNGSPGHLFAEMFKSLTGVNVVHIPYKTLGNAVTDLVSGQVQLMFTVGPLALPQVQGGRLRALAVTTVKRYSVLPNVPTMSEAGVAGYEAMSWNGVLVPAGTPQAVIDRLHGEIVKAMKSPDMLERVAALGYEPMASSPREFGEFIKAELAKWAKVARESGAKAE